MAKTVRVHDDTHAALKKLKVRKRSKSIDRVIKEMFRATTGEPVEDLGKRAASGRLTSYVEG